MKLGQDHVVFVEPWLRSDVLLVNQHITVMKTAKGRIGNNTKLFVNKSQQPFQQKRGGLILSFHVMKCSEPS